MKNLGLLVLLSSLTACTCGETIVIGGNDGGNKDGGKPDGGATDAGGKSDAGLCVDGES